MEVKRGNVYSEVIKCTPEEFKKYREILTFTVPNAWFSKRYKKKQWDGKKRYFWDKKFPTGLIHLLEQEIDIHIRERNPRQTIEFDPNILNTKSFTGKYSFQADVIKQSLLSKRGIWHLATNAGKTTISAGLTKHLDIPTLFITHSKDLMYQTHTVFTEEIGGEIGLLGDGNEDIKKITIGMPQTMVNRLDEKWFKQYLREIQLVYADECHLATAKTWVKILQKCTGAGYRFGLSGTPLDRGEIAGITLKAYTGEVIAQITNDDLIELGVSSKPVVNIITVGSYIDSDLKYPEAHKKYVVDNTTRNDIIVKIVKKQVLLGKAITILVKRIQHGKILNKLLQENGVMSVFCHGGSSTEKRQVELEEFKKSGNKVLILSKIGETGLDIPNMEVMVRAGGGKSTVSTLQAIGRLLRRGGNDNEVLFYDFNDTDNEFLRKHSGQRIEDYERENFEIRRLGRIDI
jgi:superfamily II DNA or RNA helicase